MSELTENIALEVDGEEIDLYDIMRRAKARNDLEFVQQAIDAAIIRQEATRQEIAVSDEELQMAADQFRAAHELYDVAATEAWLATKHLTFEEWELFVEETVLTRKLREAITADKIEPHFAINKLTFDAAEISRLVVSEEDIARELRAQLTEEQADFHSLARTYSIDSTTRLAGGYAGKVMRPEMEAAVESAVFGGQPGNVVGPFKLEDGWHLIKIESLHRAELDDALRETIKTQVFTEWLDQRRRKAQIKLPLLAVVAPVNDAVEDLAVSNK